MTAEEVIPETDNPAHNSRFWCLPPVRDQPSEDRRGGGYPMYLVSQGRAVGVWHNWTVCEVDGERSSVRCAGWPSHDGRVHCRVARALRSGSPPASRCSRRDAPTAGCDTGNGRTIEVERAPGGTGTSSSPTNRRRLYCMPQLASLSLEDVATTPSAADDLSSSVSSPLSITSTEWVTVPDAARYFALWGGRIIYTDRAEAREVFVEAERQEEKPKILTTTDYNEAQAFSEAIYWLCD
ncbi:hypothetical protein B0H14DRAFT_2975215 [Mycena olivaceomarginata]|nr:hypothetical protein B0H14DRAFT_2975215 [Mycena olivaceomarginata]